MKMREESMLMRSLNLMIAAALVEKSRPLLYGRPIRKTAINHEDIHNLKIALNTSKNLRDFLKQV